MRINIVRKITHNWHIKLISLALAFILWVYVDSLKQKERFISVPVDVKNVPAGYMVSNDLPSSVKVILRGKESRLALIDEKNVVAFVDLDSSTKGETKRTVRVDRDQIPLGVTIKEVEPRVVDVLVELEEKKRVKVIPVIINEPPDGFYFEDALIEPEEVFIKGPESLVKDLHSVYTKDININNLTETTVREVELNIGDSRILPEEEPVVRVRIVIKEQYVLRKFSKEEILYRNLTEELEADIEGQPISVLLRIPRVIEKDFSQDRFVLYVDLKSISSPGEFDIPVLFETVVPNISRIRLEPDTVVVKVRVKTKKQAEKQVSRLKEKPIWKNHRLRYPIT
ncbi:MAG: hypothetical protein AMS17_03095 [Spirochaetes bacterium DG_61]|jgi:YbbR domain-containing protein|nr:MAG: hypothetical protein AMS17_03095 [Spirochaetes bacterium DG_61]